MATEGEPRIRRGHKPRDIVSYFGGYQAAIQAGDRRVHIFRDGGQETFCGLIERCGYGRVGTVGQAFRRSCEDCFKLAQEVRCDV